MFSLVSLVIVSNMLAATFCACRAARWIPIHMVSVTATELGRKYNVSWFYSIQLECV